MASRQCVVSWSGGKDSLMALRRAKQAGHEICALLTMFSPENGTSRSHGLPRQLLTDQANALGLALHVGYAGWSDYEREFKRCLSALVSDGIELAVFGDIFLDDHRHWVERVCSEAGCEALEPLWGEATDRLLEETIAAGIRAHVCTVRPEHVAPSWLGAALDQGFLQSCGGGRIDPCGEHGEYHTVVLAAPDFRHQIIVDSAQVRDDTDHSHWHIRSWRTAPSGAIAARSRPTVSLGPAPPGLLRNKSKGSNESIPQATGRLFTDDECGLLEEIIFHRRDVRGNRFTKREISDQAIDRVLNAALRAPSVGFSQPWRFVVVRDPAIKLRVREDFERENLKAASHFDDSRRDLYARLKLEGITEAPVNIAVFYKKSEEAVLGQTSVDEVGPYSAVCAIQNMWLLTRALNIGMGWVSILNPSRVKNILGAPDSFQLVAYLCLGYVDRFEEQPELERLGWSSRKKLDTLVRYETWGKTDGHGALST